MVIYVASDIKYIISMYAINHKLLNNKTDTTNRQREYICVSQGPYKRTCHAMLAFPTSVIHCSMQSLDIRLFRPDFLLWICRVLCHMGL